MGPGASIAGGACRSAWGAFPFAVGRVPAGPMMTFGNGSRMLAPTLVPTLAGNPRTRGPTLTPTRGLISFPGAVGGRGGVLSHRLGGNRSPGWSALVGARVASAQRHPGPPGWRCGVLEGDSGTLESNSGARFHEYPPVSASTRPYPRQIRCAGVAVPVSVGVDWRRILTPFPAVAVHSRGADNGMKVAHSCENPRNAGEQRGRTPPSNWKGWSIRASGPTKGESVRTSRVVSPEA